MRFCILLIGLLIFILPDRSLFAQTNGDTSAYEFFVRLEDSTSLDTIEEYLEDLNSTEIWSHEGIGLALWKVSGFPFTLSNGTQVTNIYDVIRQSVRKTKISEADFNILSNLGDITLPSAGSCFDPINFSIAQGTQSTVKISILDTGIDPGIQSSTTSTLNYNFTNYSGYDYVNNDNVPEDEHGHGTHIAGIIHSITHAISSTGANVQFDIRKTHNSMGQGMMSNIVKGLLDAVDADADIINMSFGRTDTFSIDSFYPLRIAIQHALSKNVLVVIAAGNENKNIDNYINSTTPAVFPEPNILTVAALNCADNLSAFSNYGADGVDIGVLGVLIPGPDLTGGIRYASGTSQATAIASAVAAIIGTYQNNFDVSVIKCALLNGFTPESGLIGLTLKEGKVNINASLSIYQNLQNNYTVTNTTNSGAGSLRYGLEKVCGVNKIIFDPAINGQTIEVNQKQLFIDQVISFQGNGQNLSLINGQNLNAIKIGLNGNLKLKNLSITHSGNAIGSVINKGNITIDLNTKIE
jgi:subtilisin family serine protease